MRLRPGLSNHRRSTNRWGSIQPLVSIFRHYLTSYTRIRLSRIRKMVMFSRIFHGAGCRAKSDVRQCNLIVELAE